MILDSAYGLVVEEGFVHFTARGIAKRMGCSTQPLYLEFKSMGDLKQAVMDKIKEALVMSLSRRFTADPIVDLGIAYVYFALEHAPLYRAVFIEDHFGVDTMREFAITAALKRVADYAPAAHLDDDQRRNTITGLWIVATGIANLMAPGFITVTREQMEDILRAVVHDFIVNGRFSASAKTVNFALDPQ